MTTGSTESAVCGTLALKPHLDRIDDQRLAEVSDEAMVSEMVQRRYLADLRLKDKWKKQNNGKKRKLRFQRPRSIK
jgi:hypothetical protein